jgi:hypothetical protein
MSSPRCGGRRTAIHSHRRLATTTRLVAMACLLASGLASCGADRAAPTTERPSRTARNAPPAVVAAGCHQYCQQAGGYGGGQDGRPATDYVRIHNPGPVALRGDAVPITVTCLDRAPCRGAILLGPALASDLPIELGRSDLDVGSKRTQTIVVPVPPAGLRAIRNRHGGRFPIEVLADFGDPTCPGDSALPCVGTQRIVIDATAGG